MKLFKANVLFMLTLPTYGWKRFANRNPAQAIVNSIGESASEVNPTNSISLDPRNPAVYTDAMLALKRLEEKPICHRIAAQLLMKNCHGLEDINTDKYQSISSQMQRHHVESFAAGLAMCDMERADFQIPEYCAPFRSSALKDAMKGTGSINVSPENVSECLQGLGRDPAQWSTWLSYRDTALLLCRGARVEVDKSEQIELHRALTRIMEEFTTGLHNDLGNMREKMRSQAKELESHFASAKSNVDNLRDHIEENFGILLTDIKNSLPKLNSVNSAIGDAQRMLHHIVNTMIQSNAEIAASQEGSLAVVAKTYERHIGGFNDLFESVEISLLGTQEKMVNINLNLKTCGVTNTQEGMLSAQVAGMKDRMDVIEASSQKAMNATTLATELLELHAKALQEASASATQITKKLEKAAGGLSTITALISWLGWFELDWFIHLFAAVLTLYGGNYGTTPSTKKNFSLLFSGFITSYGITMLRHSIRVADWLQLLEDHSFPEAFQHSLAGGLTEKRPKVDE